MGAEADDHYLRYVVARLAAFPDIWWALANEFDLMTKSDDDWHRLRKHWCGTWIRTDIPGGSISVVLVRQLSRWITHASLQKTDGYRTAETRTRGG